VSDGAAAQHQARQMPKKKRQSNESAEKSEQRRTRARKSENDEPLASLPDDGRKLKPRKHAAPFKEHNSNCNCELQCEANQPLIDICVEIGTLLKERRENRFAMRQFLSKMPCRLRHLDHPLDVRLFLFYYKTPNKTPRTRRLSG